MDFSYLQLRVSTPYIPPHRTQLHPRMRSSPSHHPTTKITVTSFKNRLLILLAFLFTVPSLYYLFATARRVHQSSKFTDPTAQFYGIVIDSGFTADHRLRVFKFLGEGQMPYIDLVDRGRDVDLDVALERLIRFPKQRVPEKEWASTRVQLLVKGGTVKEKVLEKCRRLLRASGFVFKDEWARVIQGQEKGIYTWIATNYALGTLGGEPKGTIGIVELGGSSLQVTFARRESAPRQSLQTIRFAGVTYDLYTQSLPQFGQDGAWESLHELQNSTELKNTFSSSRKEIINTSCIPNGYKLTSKASDKKHLMSHAAGNFSACRLEALTLLRGSQDKCLRPPCQLMSSFFSGLQDNTLSPEQFIYTSEFFGLLPRASLFEMEALGRHYCENDWHKLRHQHPSTDDLDLLRYCFFSAYTVALLRDSLGIPMHDKRIGFVNNTRSMPLDWTVGAFIFHSMLQPLELEPERLDQIVGSESVMYFSFFALLLIALIAAIFVLQWQKPELKTIYDLEKGHYIVTRVPR